MEFQIEILTLTVLYDIDIAKLSFSWASIILTSLPPTHQTNRNISLLGQWVYDWNQTRVLRLLAYNGR